MLKQCHFAGNRLGVKNPDANCYDSMICMLGNTPLKHVGSLLWVFECTRIATESEFKQSSHYGKIDPDFSEEGLTNALFGRVNLTVLDNSDWRQIRDRYSRREEDMLATFKLPLHVTADLFDLRHSLRFSVDGEILRQHTIDTIECAVAYMESNKGHSYQKLYDKLAQQGFWSSAKIACLLNILCWLKSEEQIDYECLLWLRLVFGRCLPDDFEVKLSRSEDEIIMADLIEHKEEVSRLIQKRVHSFIQQTPFEV